MSVWPDTVGRIIDGKTSFSANSLGVIVDTIVQRTDWLKEFSDNFSEDFEGVRGFTFYDTGISPECSVGMLVAWDSGTGVYVPALAAGTGKYREDGTEIPADSANVVGVLVSTNPSTTGGTILCCGYINDPDVVTKMVEHSGSTGNYYLSSSIPGAAYNAQTAEGPMSPYCFTYLYSTNNKKASVFVRPYPPAYNGTSEIRKVSVSDSDLLTADTVNGEVTLKLSTRVVDVPEFSGRALCGVGSDSFVANKVINDVLPGAGIIVSQNSPGVVHISTDASLLTEYDINLCALDGVYIGTSETNSVIYTFPAGTDSSLIGVVRAPYLGEIEAQCDISILLEGTGGSSGLTELCATVQRTKDNVNAKATAVPYPIPAVAATDSSKIYKITVHLDQPVLSRDVVYLKLKALAPPIATRVLSVSATFSVPESGGDV